MPALKWTRERIIEAVHDYAAVFGSPPSAEDWNVSMARKNGRHDKADWFYLFGDWPHYGSVTARFGSFNAAIEAAGFTPRPDGIKRADVGEPRPEPNVLAMARLAERINGESDDALILVLSAIFAEGVGTDIDRLVAYTGFPREWVAACAQRMEVAGLWVDGKPGLEDPEDESGLELILHSLVAAGELVRVTAEKSNVVPIRQAA
jgi:Homing endonuclease associated repeat